MIECANTECKYRKLCIESNSISEECQWYIKPEVKVNNKLIRISEQRDWIIDYDPECGMYRVSYFQDNHFVDECWFDAYEDKEVKEKAFGDAKNNKYIHINSNTFPKLKRE